MKNKTLETAKNVAVIVSRVSDIEQAKGYSLEAQQEQTHAYCKKHNLLIVSEFVFYGDKKLDHYTRRRMINFIKYSKVPITVVVDKAIRLFRSKEDVNIFNDLVKYHNLSISYAADNTLINKHTDNEPNLFFIALSYL